MSGAPAENGPGAGGPGSAVPGGAGPGGAGPVNEGVQISGGSVNVGAMAVGRQARIGHVTTHVSSGGAAPTVEPAGQADAEVPGDGPATAKDLQALLVELGDQVEAQRSHLSDPEGALRLVAELRDLLEQPQPEREQARSLLTRLVEALRPVGELAALTTAVGEAVRSVLGLR